LSAATPADRRWLDAAVRTARPWLGTTAGKPLAAALVIDPVTGILHGRGVTGPGTTAEAAALAMAGDRARGAMLVATMEPAPEPLTEAGIARLVVGVRHPDPSRAGKANTRLRDAGIDVTLVEHAPSRDLLAPVIMRINRRRPFVTIVLVLSKDGMLGRRDGTPIAPGDAAGRWIAAQTAQADARMSHSGELLELETFAPPAAKWHILDRNGRPNVPSALSDLLARDVSALLAVPDALLAEALIGAGLADRLHLVQTGDDLGRDGVPATALGTIEGRLRAARLAQVATAPLGEATLRTFEPGA
jgi:diaminohydroxyphosphoribosylaminopyrimidine deaminase/5-amino-6-(5-phosphoribosylamino)uracil reductase